MPEIVHDGLFISPAQMSLPLHLGQAKNGRVCSISGTDWAASPKIELLIPWTSIMHVLKRVAVATKISESITTSALVKIVESVRNRELLYNQDIEYTRGGTRS